MRETPVPLLPLPGMGRISCRLGTVRGPVGVEGLRAIGDLAVSVPANAVAEVHLPDPGTTEGGLPLAKVPGLRVLCADTAGTVVEVGSGTYQFHTP